MTVRRTHHEKIMDEVSRSALHRETVSFYASYIAQLRGCRVLDFGAGSGKVSSALTELPAVAELIAFDREPGAMRELKEGAKVRKVAEGTHRALPFEDGLFDFVVCRYVLHHVDGRTEALAEICRVLREGGLLLISDAIMPPHSRDVLNGIYRIRDDHFEGFWTYHEWLDELGQAGLDVEAIRPSHYRYPNLSEYLDGVVDGFHDAGIGDPVDGKTVELLQKKVMRAWNMVDDQVRREMKITGSEMALSFRYPLADMAARKSAAADR